MSDKSTSRVAVLRGNGLLVPSDFPTAPYESIYSAVEAYQAGHPLYEHHSGAWNALAYRFRAMTDSGEAFATLMKSHGSAPKPEERYLQEKALFDFFSAGFSVFECAFYGLYAIGAFLKQEIFVLSSARDQQQVSPAKTRDAFTKAFPADPILSAFAALFADPKYQEWREIRNVLTHRTAPGRRIYVSIGDDDAPPAEWKVNNSPLDSSIVSNGRRELSRLLTGLLTAGADFVLVRLK